MSVIQLPISVVILCRNEAANLPRCIAAVARSCPDVLVVDDNSSDDSPGIAQRTGARVVTHPFASFAGQRNWAMQHAGLGHDWVLHLDADEVMTPAALLAIGNALPLLRPDNVGWIARKIMLDDRWLRFSADYPVYVPRLVHRSKTLFVMRGHGDTVDAEAGTAFYLPEPLLHFAFSKGWPEWRQRHLRYAGAEARRIHDGMAAFSWPSLVSRDPSARRTALRTLSYRLPGRPVLRFLYAYVLRLGFLDGRPGLAFCRAMSEYEAMINSALKRMS